MHEPNMGLYAKDYHNDVKCGNSNNNLIVTQSEWVLIWSNFLKINLIYLML